MNSIKSVRVCTTPLAATACHGPPLTFGQFQVVVAVFRTRDSHTTFVIRGVPWAPLSTGRYSMLHVVPGPSQNSQWQNLHGIRDS
ncbi:hypothetical protein BDR03DRAFT_738822 [Suillus americanus]|nr:hypothetical protein BDR03DRAFT_738822 [Suillus americanus]